MARKAKFVWRNGIPHRHLYVEKIGVTDLASGVGVKRMYESLSLASLVVDVVHGEVQVVLGKDPQGRNRWRCTALSRGGGWPRRRCQFAKNWSKANDVETYMIIKSTSFASKRAQEHQNWSPESKVTAKTVKNLQQSLGRLNSLAWIRPVRFKARTRSFSDLPSGPFVRHGLDSPGVLENLRSRIWGCGTWFWGWKSSRNWMGKRNNRARECKGG